MNTNHFNINRFKVSEQNTLLEIDPVVIEEPLQLSLSQGKHEEVYSLTMRTPGDDHYLCFGLLFSEGLISSAQDILSLKVNESEKNNPANLVCIEISAGVNLDLEDKRRRYPSYSGCGLCGKTSLKALELKQSRPLKNIETQLNNELVKQLKHCLAKQPLFSQTGGSHVAGLIYEKDGLLDLETGVFFEDVGRHNALDKLIGYELINNDLQQAGILVLSGRIGFELVQKAVMAGYSLIVALGAPSNLAIQAAFQFNITLVGFAKDNSFNLYTADTELLG